MLTGSPSSRSSHAVDVRVARFVGPERQGNLRQPLPMGGAGAAGYVVPSVRFDHATLAVRVPRPHPVGKRAVRAVLVAPLRHHVEIPVGSEKLFAAAAIRRIGVEYRSRAIPEEDAVAGEVFQGRVGVPIVIVGASRGDVFGSEGHVEVVVEVALVGRNPGQGPAHALAYG